MALNNQVLVRFSDAERARIGVHTCPGGGQDSTHSADVDYALCRVVRRSGARFMGLRLRDGAHIVKVVKGRRRPNVLPR